MGLAYSNLLVSSVSFDGDEIVCSGFRYGKVHRGIHVAELETLQHSMCVGPWTVGIHEGMLAVEAGPLDWGEEPWWLCGGEPPPGLEQVDFEQFTSALAGYEIAEAHVGLDGELGLRVAVPMDGDCWLAATGPWAISDTVGSDDNMRTVDRGLESIVGSKVESIKLVGDDLVVSLGGRSVHAFGGLGADGPSWVIARYLGVILPQWETVCLDRPFLRFGTYFRRRPTTLRVIHGSQVLDERSVVDITGISVARHPKIRVAGNNGRKYWFSANRFSGSASFSGDWALSRLSPSRALLIQYNIQNEDPLDIDPSLVGKTILSCEIVPTGLLWVTFDDGRELFVSSEWRGCWHAEHLGMRSSVERIEAFANFLRGRPVMAVEMTAVSAKIQFGVHCSLEVLQLCSLGVESH